MGLPGSYLVVCEGASEANYLQNLNRLLATLPPPEGLLACPVRFNLPKLDEASCDKKSEYAGRCVGNGFYSSLLKAWKKTVKDNRGTDILIWCDCDLYSRNDKDCYTNYIAKSKHIPDFHFSFQNFEDFIAMHFDDDAFHGWLDEMSKIRHWGNPLHSDDYLPLFQRHFPDYAKGSLPDDWLSLQKLNNMRRHIAEVHSLNLNPIPNFLLFAEFLSKTLHRFYLEVFP